MVNAEVLKWLIVEDDPVIREIVKLGCDMMGHPARIFANSKQTLAWMDESIPESEIPDIALVDIRMPGGLDGHELAAHMRRHENLSDIVIVLMTAYELPGSQREEVMTVSGADMLLFKPLPPLEELADTVRELAAERKSRS